MTSRVIRGGKDTQPGALSSIIISCDNMECRTALNDEQIAKGGGLKNMGWQTRVHSGRLHHYCPKHT